MAKFDFKKAAVNHVEKAVFGVVLLLVLAGLVRTRWIPYQGTPEEITQAIESGRKAVLANHWPDSEREKYKLSDSPAQIVDVRLRRPIDPSPYELSGKMVVDLWGGNEPVKEPETLPPQDLLATSARAYLQLADTGFGGSGEASESESESESESLAAADTKPDEPMIKDEFVRRQTPLVSNPTKTTEQRSYEQARAAKASQMMQNIMRQMMMSGTTDLNKLGSFGDGAAMVTNIVPRLKGEGHNFVSVRAVFPLREQIRKYQEAIHKSYTEAAATFEIRDFEMERQVMQPGDDPWSGPWEPVNLDVAEDILDKVAGFDAEVVNSIIVNQVITMPLPMRISGIWGKRTATHPRISNFELSSEEMAEEVEMQTKLIDACVEQGKKLDEDTASLGGFTKFQFDTRQIQADLMNLSSFSVGTGGMGAGAAALGYGGGAPADAAAPSERTLALTRVMRGTGRTSIAAGIMQNPQDALVQQLLKGEMTPAEREKLKKKIEKWISGQLTADGELLLIRYLDFDVDPGKTYRYRVRLVLANPNFGRRASDAGGLQEVVEGETRVTPWSNVTEPASVPYDVQYFITEIRQQPDTLARGRLDVFQWDRNHGTTMNQQFDVRPGQQIAEKTKTTVIDPAVGLNAEQEYQFACPDFLVDVMEDLQLDSEFHSKSADGMNINFIPGSRGSLRLPPRALISTVSRGLTVLNAADRRQSQQYATLKEEKQLQAAQFEDIKGQSMPDLEGVDTENLDTKALAAQYGVSEDQVKAYIKGKTRTGSALQKNRTDEKSKK